MRRIATYLFFLSLLLLAAGYGLKSYPLLKVSYVDIKGSDKLTPADFPVTIGQNLLDVDFGKIVAAATKHQFVVSASAKGDQYGKITIDISEKHPVAYIYIDDLYGLTSRCELIPSDLNDSGLHLPVVRGVQVKHPFPFSFVDEPGLRQAIELIGAMQIRHPQLFDALSEIVLDDSQLRLIYEPGSIVVNFGWDNIDQKLESLENILMTNKNPGIDIDLRLTDIAVLKSRMINKEVNHGI